MHQLEETLSRLSETMRLLDEATEDLAETEHVAVKAKVAYLRSYNSYFLQADGAMDFRKAGATLHALEDLQHMELCEANVRITKERIRTLNTQIDVLRTTAAGQRVAWQAEPTGQWS